MHIGIVALILLWLQGLSTGSAAPAPANSTAELLSIQAYRPTQLVNDPRPHAVQIVDYPIPGTTIIIRFILGSPLPPNVMSVTIVSACNLITSTIASEGDGVLPTSQDPFVYNKGYGAFIAAHSSNGRRLTWSLLEGAVVGLYNGLYLRGIYKTSEFLILDRREGLMGAGEMGADGVGGGGRNGTAGWWGMARVEKKDNNGSGNVTGSGKLEISEN